MKPIHFKVKEYPEIIVEETHFKIKAIDYWEFRVFKFYEIELVEVINPQKNWFNQLFNTISPIARKYATEEPLILRVTRKNQGIWDYKIPNKYDEDFNEIIRLINSKV